MCLRSRPVPDCRSSVQFIGLPLLRLCLYFIRVLFGFQAINTITPTPYDEREAAVSWGFYVVFSVTLSLSMFARQCS